MARLSLRVGDAERLAVADQLAAHATAGRLTLHEYDQRVVAAWTAVTRTDLDRLLNDLPVPAEQPPTSDLRGRLATTAAITAVVAVVLLWLVSIVDPGVAAVMVAACM
jgi:hypothetical protein